MIYCMSDIHGRIDLFDKMLEQINLKEGDMLYILGDCIDEGGGLKVLLKIKELADKGLATLLMGNHELAFLYLSNKHKTNEYIEEVVQTAFDYEKKQKILSEKIQEYSSRGGFSGMSLAFANLYKKADYVYKVQQLNDCIEESIRTAIDCSMIGEWEVYKDMEEFSNEELASLFTFWNESIDNTMKEVVVNNKHFLLVHGGLDENINKCLMVREEFYTKPVNKELLQKYGASADCKVVFGHTTTRDINFRLNHTYIAPHKIWYDEKYKDKIGIDCAACYPNGQLACLRLDDMKEFYVRNEEKFITPIYKLNWCLDSLNKKMKMWGDTQNE